uniref:Uncharacterized protein n=1 Tax=Romanomermis culicivorax TaxID=13658 RepID=A0A915KZ33_ROMCU
YVYTVPQSPIQVSILILFFIFIEIFVNLTQFGQRFVDADHRCTYWRTIVSTNTIWAFSLLVSFAVKTMHLIGNFGVYDVQAKRFIGCELQIYIVCRPKNDAEPRKCTLNQKQAS